MKNKREEKKNFKSRRIFTYEFFVVVVVARFNLALTTIKQTRNKFQEM